ncbi:MAG: hypothetical protein QM541_03415 [Flavobacterium sp.]|nr:hypothetical protein [Flavobacterium sp.]
MNIVYFVIGEKIDNHLQAAFSITTFLAFNNNIATINIITDFPAQYKLFGDKVNIIEVNEVILKKWKGDYNFFWRIKIKAIQEVCRLYPNKPVLYVDADTFCLQNADLGLLQFNASMHINEGPFAAKKSKTERKMWHKMKGQSFGGITVTANNCMWNAGVVATPNTTNLYDIELALAICDEMCKAKIIPRLIEQAALSIALSSCYPIISADKNIAHYWSNKQEWNIVISNLFSQCFLESLSFLEIIDKIRTFNFSEIVLDKKVRNTNVRLKKIVDQLYPTTNFYLHK